MLDTIFKLSMMNDKHESKGDQIMLIGVSLASEAYLDDSSCDVRLGTVPARLESQSLQDLRGIINDQLPSAPASFIFLSKHGWPVNRSQEESITAHHIMQANIIRLHRCYDKPRVGVKTKSGTAIGFVFVNHNSPVSLLREAITEQLGQPGGVSYQFIDRNGWPLTQRQETCLTVIDVLHQSTAVIQPTSMMLSVDNVDSEGVSSSNTSPEDDILLNIIPTKRPRLHLKQLTYQTSKDVDRQISADESATLSQRKEILISYVRSEAAQHAVELKHSLISQGCTSVFLDVHEIKSGVDWQDSLNFAVSNCEIFVPLVTPRYGETLWTNREVKLADMLSKLIVPVSFLTSWPPRCLAIQFATTQFVSTLENKPTKFDADQLDSEQSMDDQISPWTDEEATRVAKLVLERVHLHHKQTEFAPDSQESRKLTLKSCPSSLPQEFQSLSQHREGRPLIVISLHPQQQPFGVELKTFLVSCGYEVWCSTEMLTEDLSAKEEDNSLGSEDELFNEEAEILTQPIGTMETDNCLSQLSQLSVSHSPGASRDVGAKRDLRLRFQEKSDEAGVIIFLLSKAFAQSRSSRMQIFYCEHRKRVLALKHDDFCMPSWMSMLIGTGIIEDVRCKNYQESLKTRLQESLQISPQKPSTNEEAVTRGVKILKEIIPKGIYVYVSGGTKFYKNGSSDICKAIGKHLAPLDDVSMVTGGFYGVGRVTSTAYHEARLANSKDSSLWHVLPTKDAQDRWWQTEQKEDGSFSAPLHGRTVFCGDSVRERETIVSRVFDICLLIEGGPGAAHEAEQFSWNGHVVIPIKATGGAAAGKFNVPDKIFKIPCGIDKKDWNALSDRNFTAEQIGQAVANIVRTLRDRLIVDSPTDTESPPLTSLPIVEEPSTPDHSTESTHDSTAQSSETTAQSETETDQTEKTLTGILPTETEIIQIEKTLTGILPATQFDETVKDTKKRRKDASPRRKNKYKKDNK